MIPESDAVNEPDAAGAGATASPRPPAAGAQPTPSADAPAVHDILVVLVKAQKAQRLYQGKSPVLDRLEQELLTKLSTFLERCGPLNLKIREFQILYGEDVVYENKNRNDSLAFLLFRDGLRKLSFDPGVEQRELRSLLGCLGRTVAGGNQQHDMVTLLWEQDFSAIRYFAVEELSAEAEGPRLEEQLASGSTGEGGGGGKGGEAVEAVSLKDLKQPLQQLPIQECRLSERETATLRSQLSRESENAFWVRVVELAVELMLLETSPTDRDNLFRCLVGILDQVLAEGDVEAVAGIPEHTNGLARLFPSADKLHELERQLLRSLAEPARLGRFLELVKERRSFDLAQLTTYLVRLDDTALESTVAWIPRMPTSPQRRALARAVAEAGERGARHVVPPLVGASEPPSPELLREGFFVLSQLPTDQVLPALPKLLASAHPGPRRETMRLLSRLRVPAAHELCVKLLADEDPEVRGPALDTLVRHEQRDMAHSMLQTALGAPGFGEWGLAEKRRLFVAVAKLGKDEAVDWMAASLGQQDRGWFASRSDREALEATAHGLRVIGSPRALETLRGLASSKDRHVRAACQKELESLGD